VSCLISFWCLGYHIFWQYQKIWYPTKIKRHSTLNSDESQLQRISTETNLDWDIFWLSQISTDSEWEIEHLATMLQAYPHFHSSAKFGICACKKCGILSKKHKKQHLDLDKSWLCKISTQTNLDCDKSQLGHISTESNLDWQWMGNWTFSNTVTSLPPFSL